MSGIPVTVRIAALGIGIHAINHIIVLLTSPFSWNVGTVYHLLGAPIYAALIPPILRGRNWARITITVLLVCQFGGRFVVWALWPSEGVRAALVFGWVLSLLVFVMLWAPRGSRAHFRPRVESSGTPATE
ncbi:hypothetical protein [Nocardia huaxiensis]|uniref:Uncharacterized protein n=1 Tax=Nocardia huaxiensis TaxID=2755382 RepID=A0A7D6VB15_9NOCA|nr:hypothetical protein [Nocardia huaxiensis]QLY30853.1 hypothetical protein H0264_00040 [Nocardia huaxiensis]UFS94360.1 hypothetical protein LPY97_26830 [Nocardia huaxiensis]